MSEYGPHCYVRCCRLDVPHGFTLERYAVMLQKTPQQSCSLFTIISRCDGNCGLLTGHVVTPCTATLLEFQLDFWLQGNIAATSLQITKQIVYLHCLSSRSEGGFVMASNGLSPNAEAQQRAMQRYQRQLQSDPQLQVYINSLYTEWQVLQHPA